MTETETETTWSQAEYVRSERTKLVFDEPPEPLVSSDRKEAFRARYVCEGGNASAIPVVAVFFNDRRAFEKEFEKLELANGLGVGPRVFDVCHREKPQAAVEIYTLDAPDPFCSPDAASDACVKSAARARKTPDKRSSASMPSAPLASMPEPVRAQSDRSAFPCLVEEDLGVSLASMISEGAAAPCIGNADDSVRLAPVGSDERARQAAKVAFDVGAELAAMHGRGAFYLDLKPSNVCVRAYGESPADIRAGLVDFESLVASNRPSDYSTLSCYDALCTYARAKGVAAPMLTNLAVDLGFLLLLAASALRGKAARHLSIVDIDAACALPGMGFFAIRYGCFDVRPIAESHLAALADFAGVARARPQTQVPLKDFASSIPEHLEAKPPERNPTDLPGTRDEVSSIDAAPSEQAESIRNKLLGHVPENCPESATAPSKFVAALFSEDCAPEPPVGRFGFCDAVDELRASMNPLYVLAKRKFDIALACHGDWRRAASSSRSDAIDDFFAQDPVKIKQGLRQAQGILDYVARLGCALIPEQLADLPRYRARRVEQLSCGQVLLVAQWEHESWRALHEQLGFRYAERNADGTRPEHANEYLLTWEDLCETPESGAAPLPANAPRDAALARLWNTRARNDIAFACGIVDKLRSIDLVVVNETYRPPTHER